MAQAKTLTTKELRRVLDHTATRRHAARNRAMILLTHWAGLRVGEVAALRIGDVIDGDGAVRSEIRLDAAQTKGKHARKVFVGERTRRELMAYARTLAPKRTADAPLFTSNRGRAFSANVACQTMNAIYAAAGVDGATSHSGRRSFITTLASKGIGVRVLASLAGHRSIATTQAYIDVNDDMKRAAVELIG